MYYQRYAPHVYRFISNVGKQMVNTFNWGLFHLTGKKNIRELYLALMNRFERFVVKRASKFAYTNSQDTGLDIRKGI